MKSIEWTSETYIPEWLSSKNKSEAIALCEIGFWYIGSVDKWGEPEDKKIIKIFGDWSFNYDYTGMFVEARVGGAVFNIDVYESTKEDDKKLVDKAILTIKKSSDQWGEQFGEQLNLLALISGEGV